MDRVTLYLGDCLDVMRELPDASVDSVVTDPPYGLEFMGREWDKLGATTEVAAEGADRSHPFRDGTRRVRYGESARSMQAWHEQWATEAFRVLKPGGYLLAFGGTRTYHRLASAIEDAGFEIRDTLMWIYASGFPKSLDVSKALDKAAGAEREVVGTRNDNGRKVPKHQATHGAWEGLVDVPITAPATDLARKWEGWGTALKPAHEPIVMARKPLVGTVAQNVTRYGTGALNIDGTRIGTDGGTRATNFVKKPDGRLERWDEQYQGARNEIESINAGRWPSNVLLSSPELFDEPNPYVVGSGATTTVPGTYQSKPRNEWQASSYPGSPPGDVVEGYGDSGGYSRFFIIPKADRAERERGLTGVNGARGNTHPTVKSLDLMRHLVRLVTPPGGVVLDPFLGSGTTALAASEEGFRCIGIEREAEYLEIAKGRLMATPMGLGL